MRLTEGLKPGVAEWDTIEFNVIDKIKGLPGKKGFYYENLVTGERAAWNEDERMMAASVIKLFVMTEAFKIRRWDIES